MGFFHITILLAVIVGFDSEKEGRLRERAQELAHDTIIVDGHIDVPYRLWRKMEDISVRTEGGQFDYPRARAGGLDAPFMSIYVPSEYEEKGGGRALADSLIDIVEGIAARWPDKFSLALSVSQVRRNFAGGKVSLLLGMENGTAIEGKLENLKHFFDRGIRYITLAHARDNHICDSSYDTTQTWKGLSPFGSKVVSEMNRLGIMIDVSHVTDEAFYQIIELSRAPVIDSHSSCRYFTPGWERNISDEMIKRIAEKGGVVLVNFGSTFLKEELRKKAEEAREHIENYLKKNNLKRGDEAARAYIKKYMKENPIGFADVSDVVEHISHIVQLVGVDHVGLGSDFEGLGDTLPVGLKDVSAYPNLIFELLKAGYREDEIRKICSENIFRVWAEVERVARAWKPPR